MDEFESTLKSLLGGKRVSQSKIEALTKLALSNMENDSQMISVLYRTHKSLPAASKVPSLYVFDAIARAARSYANKTRADPSSTRGNAATFLAKMEVILDGLVQDMISTDAPEAKEKTSKVLDIWAKASTFSPAVITRLQGIVQGFGGSGGNPAHSNGFDKPGGGNYLSSSASSNPVQTVIDPRKAASSTLATVSQQTTSTARNGPNTVDASSILAMLSQAQNASSTPVTSSGSSTTPAQTLDSAQLALLQQLAGSLPGASSVQPQSSTQPAYPAPAQHINQARSPGSPRGPRRDTRFEQRPSPPTRRDYREREYNRDRDYRDRGDRYDDRPRYSDHRDRYNDRDRDRDPNRRTDWRDQDHVRRRSGSPRRDSYRRDRDDAAGPSSSHRVTTSHRSVAPGPDVDEFGRERRPTSTDDPQDTRQKSPTAPANVDGMPISPAAQDPPSVNSTIAPSVDTTPAPSVAAEQPATVVKGMDSIDFSTLDFSSPDSWVKLQEAWTITNGGPPTQEELMMYVMGASMQVMQWTGMGMAMDWDAGQGNTGTFTQQQSPVNVDTNGHAASANGVSGSANPEAPPQGTGGGGTGGRMIRVGDKWKWVAAT